MNLHYLITELRHRPARTLTGILSIAMGVALFVSLQAYADGYRQAARAPLVQVGADLTAQRQGTVPAKFEGMVFPHSTAPIHRDEINQIRQLPGVQGVAEVLFFWSFEPSGFVAGLGLDPSDTFGPGRLKAAVTAGRFLQPGDHAVAVADTTYAQQNRLSVSSVVSLDGESFTIVGLADTSRAGQLASANLYIPLADARTLANAAPQVRSVFDIRPDDANLLFLKTDQTRVEEVAARVKTILGDKAIVSSGQSFAAELGSLFALIDRFGLLVGLIAFLFATALLLRVVASSMWERRREVAVMRAVGWRRRDVMLQLWSETLALAVAGGFVGLVFAALTTWGMSHVLVTVPVPWELSPSPHFLPGGAQAEAVTIALPAHLTLELAASALALSIVGASLVGLWLPGRIAKIHPAEVLRSE
ncbi:MAG: ABC transporter permease [Chloroflexi bacterium]|nr:ABC transporter permease [Chloroflexota bacterium]